MQLPGSGRPAMPGRAARGFGFGCVRRRDSGWQGLLRGLPEGAFGGYWANSWPAKAQCQRGGLMAWVWQNLRRKRRMSAGVKREKGARRLSADWEL